MYMASSCTFLAKTSPSELHSSRSAPPEDACYRIKRKQLKIIFMASVSLSALTGGTVCVTYVQLLKQDSTKWVP